MAGVNTAILLGNLGSDPEIRTTPGGQRVANFRIATSRSWTDSEGQRQEKTEWHSIVAWGKLAEVCEKYLTKGKQVYIQGRLETRSWEDKEGQKRYKTEIVCESMQMLGGGSDRSVERSGGAPARAQSAPGPAPATAGAAGTPRGDSNEDEDLPF